MDSQEEEWLRELARQLREPHGGEGIRVAAKIHTSNVKMTRSCFAAEPAMRYQGLELSALIAEAGEKANRERVRRGAVRTAVEHSPRFGQPRLESRG